MSRTLSRIALPTLLVLGLAACTTTTPSAPAASPDPAHTSRNAVDWAGTYEGGTPCTDCPGIKLRLTLRADGRYELATQYLERQPAPQTVRGNFSWNAAGNTITLLRAGSCTVTAGQAGNANYSAAPDVSAYVQHHQAEPDDHVQPAAR